ncbi:MAG: DEAD/DEAH box helicase [Candidatus Altiarchaeales archaeon]|nr:DEAD/DEAH box helicase [Candidatus Altiarchaeales archaeon]
MGYGTFSVNREGYAFLQGSSYRHRQEVGRSILSLLQQVQAAQQPATPKSLLERVQEAYKGACISTVAFDKFAKNHRAHQNTAIDAILSHDNGQVSIPTGTGKTRIQIHTHVYDMLRKSENNEIGVYVIGAHRLLLCKQLMDELQDLCFSNGVRTNVLYVGSARHDDKVVYDEYFNEGVNTNTFEMVYTTQRNEVEEFWKKTQAQGRHLIVVSTYHSFNGLSAIESIDICTYDEAHTTISEDFTNNILAVMPHIKRNYFFTATRKVNGEDGGMNNTEMYGEVICDISPREMIKAGEITMPRIHVLHLDDTRVPKGMVVSDKNERMLVKTVIEGFTEHKERVKADSADPNTVGAKLLVSCKGSDELATVQNSPYFQEWCSQNNVHVFSYSTRFGSWNNFKEDVNRNRVYDSMCALKDEDDAILLHIDILAEGIDLPSLTGVMLLRHLNVSKLLQTLGRALRLMKTDRKRLYEGTIKPDERDKYVKPFAYMLLPMHFEGMEASAEEMKRTIQTVVQTYDSPVEEFLPLEEFEALKNQYLDPVTDAKKIAKRQKDYPLLHVIEDIIMDEFQVALPSDPQERYDKLMSMIGSLNEGDLTNA